MVKPKAAALAHFLFPHLQQPHLRQLMWAFAVGCVFAGIVGFTRYYKAQ